MKRLDYYYPTLGGSWLIVLLLLASSLIFGIALILLKQYAPSPIWNASYFSYLLSMVLPLAFIFYTGGFRRKQGFQAIPVNRPEYGQMKGWQVFAVAAVAMIALTVVIDPLTALMPMPDKVKALFEQVFLQTNLFDSILATCILAPLLEELLCRGMMLRGIAHFSGPRKAIFWSAFLFALIHLNPWQAVPAFALGLLFGWLYYRTGCLWLTIFLHCLNNSLSTVLTRTIPDMGMDTSYMDLLSTENYIGLYVGCVVLLAGAIWLFNKYLRKPEVQ